MSRTIRRMMRRTISRTASGRGSALGLGLLGAALASTATARAGDFDESGRYLPASGAIAFEDFAAPPTFVPEDLDPACVGEVHYVVQATAGALSGAEVIVLDGARMTAERPSPRLGAHTDEVLSDPSWCGVSVRS